MLILDKNVYPPYNPHPSQAILLSNWTKAACGWYAMNMLKMNAFFGFFIRF